MGLINFALPWTMFGIAAHHVPSGMSAITNASTPLWAAIFTTILIRADRLGPRGIAGLLLGFAGVAVLMESRVTGLNRDSLLGVPVMLIGTAGYGVSVAVIRRWLHHVHPLPLTFGQVTVAAAVLFPSALATGAFDGVDWRWQEVTSLLILGGIGSGIMSMAYMWLIGAIGPVRAASITYLMPPVGIGLGWLLLDESVAWSMLFGVLLIFAGIALVQGRIPNLGRFRARSLAANMEP
jgi:drug/metabolite transporter (DMT)-like permease